MSIIKRFVLKDFTLFKEYKLDDSGKDLLNAFFSEVKDDLKAYRCNGSTVELTMPLLNQTTYGGKEYWGWNKDLFQTDYEKTKIIGINGLTDFKRARITGINGLVGTIRKSFKYNNEDYDVTVVIRSRFDSGDKNYFLWTMLSEALTGVAEESQLTSSANDPHDIPLSDILKLLLFRFRVNDAFEHGVYRTYVRTEYNNDRLRGAIDIPRHIRLNYKKDPTKIAYTTRERTENNALNRLIIFAWEHLQRECGKAVDIISHMDTNAQTGFEAAIKEIRGHVINNMGDVRECIISNQRPITSAFYESYEQLRTLCLEILDDEANGLFCSGSENTRGILFYVPDLWERFLQIRMLQSLLDTDFRLQAQNEIPYYLSISKDSPEQSVFNKARPDYVFYKEADPCFVLDAKFKKFKKDEANNTSAWVSRIGVPSVQEEKDISADFDKLMRDMVCTGTHACGIIFPYNEGIYSTQNLDDLTHYISEYNTTDRFYHFPVNIPNTNSVSDFETWHTNLNVETERILEKLKEALRSTTAPNR